MFRFNGSSGLPKTFSFDAGTAQHPRGREDDVLFIVAMHRYSTTSAICLCTGALGTDLLVFLWASDENSESAFAYRVINDAGIEVYLTSAQLSTLSVAVRDAPIGLESILFSADTVDRAYPVLTWPKSHLEFLLWIRDTYCSAAFVPTAIFGGKIAGVLSSFVLGNGERIERGTVYFGILTAQNHSDILFYFLQAARSDPEIRFIVFVQDDDSGTVVRRMSALLDNLFVGNVVLSIEGHGVMSFFDFTARQGVVPRWVTFHRKLAMGDVLWLEPLCDTRLVPEEAILQINSDFPTLFRHHPRVTLATQFPAEIISRVHFDRYVDFDGVYEADQTIHFGDAYGRKAGYLPARDPILYLPDKGIDFLTSAEQTIWDRASHRIAIHLAMTSPDRIWPLAYWRHLIDQLLAIFAEIVIAIIGARDDASAIDIGFTDDEPRIIDLTRRLDILSVGQLLADCDALIAVDSGLSHIGIAVGTKVVCLYSMALPQWRASKMGNTIPIVAPVNCIGCLSKIPVNDPPLCRYGRSFCYDMILPEAVTAVVVNLLHESTLNRDDG
jgi:hypothetical protein